MHLTDDCLYPENMSPLIITTAPHAPTWLPGDASDISVTWDEQVQMAVDCYNAGATVIHLHVPPGSRVGGGKGSWESCRSCFHCGLIYEQMRKTNQLELRRY